MQHPTWWHGALAVGVALMGVAPAAILADGVEELGPPVGIVVAEGSGIAAAGTGLFAQPGTIDIDVPLGATVKQVLLYWYGRGEPDDNIIIEGIPVDGDNIGGVAAIGATGPSNAFRADITALELVGPGNTLLEVEGLTFTFHNSGAGILVIYEDATGPAIVDLRDGHDFASPGFVGPLSETVPQTYAFPSDTVDRIVKLILFIANGTEERADAIDITVNGETTTLYDEVISRDGDQWDTIPLDVVLPAGETDITVEVKWVGVLEDDPPPDSICWIVGAAWLQVEEPPEGEGCTPGYWKTHPDNWVGYDPTELFNNVFGVVDPDDLTLMEALWAGGGGKYALGRHAVAALLNAAHPDVDY